ncbi:SGNH/GDSL hydrolase family protein [Maribacter sp. 2307ULW6-5]|uniref:SGNH/GDSL hydrolase family protein n=1 Tax=Maribacter sp. 2307ULW6-5 TaxID=3386275 RepID=UPI0039BC37FC
METSFLNKVHFLVIVGFSVLQVSCQDADPARILTIGDSNGAAKHGWVVQLKKMMPNDSIYNVSIPGNTIGFDNLDNPKLNTVSNIDGYLAKAEKQMGGIDHVVILLGTNDAKAVFDSVQPAVIDNLRRLLRSIEHHGYRKAVVPEIIVVSPPPYGKDELLAEKYKGAGKRVRFFIKEFEKVAAENNIKFVNIYEPLAPEFDTYSDDGVHLDAEGQQMIATAIKAALGE